MREPRGSGMNGSKEVFPEKEKVHQTEEVHFL
jgi:hypothetical protein